jgi:hypothetical protein
VTYLINLINNACGYKCAMNTHLHWRTRIIALNKAVRPTMQEDVREDSSDHQILYERALAHQPSFVQQQETARGGTVCDDGAVAAARVQRRQPSSGRHASLPAAGGADARRRSFEPWASTSFFGGCLFPALPRFFVKLPGKLGGNLSRQSTIYYIPLSEYVAMVGVLRRLLQTLGPARAEGHHAPAGLCARDQRRHQGRINRLHAMADDKVSGPFFMRGASSSRCCWFAADC